MSRQKKNQKEVEGNLKKFGFFQFNVFSFDVFALSMLFDSFDF